MVNSSFQTFSAAAWLYPFQNPDGPPFVKAVFWGNWKAGLQIRDFVTLLFEGTVTAVIPVKTGIQGPKNGFLRSTPLRAGLPAMAFAGMTRPNNYSSSIFSNT
jgi:hypothetical protein